MLLSGRGTTRIKRGHRIWPNHTPRSMSIQWDTVLFGRMGSPNIYLPLNPVESANDRYNIEQGRLYANSTLRGKWGT